MSRARLWEYVLPEIEKNNITIYFNNEKFLFSALDCMPGDASLRLALLLCGVGEAGARAACRRLKLSNKMTEAVTTYVAALSLDCPLTEADVRRYLAALGEYAEGALTLAGACRSDQKESYQAALLLTEIIRARGDCLRISELALDGKVLMEELGLRGRAVGEMLSRLLEAVLEEPSANERQTLLNLAKSLK